MTQDLHETSFVDNKGFHCLNKRHKNVIQTKSGAEKLLTPTERKLRVGASEHKRDPFTHAICNRVSEAREDLNGNMTIVN